MKPGKEYGLDPGGGFVAPTLEDMQIVEWRERLPSGMVETFRRLSRDKLLWIRSLQINVVNVGKCVPGIFCSKCPVADLENRFTGFSGPVACSLVTALLAVEKGFFSVTTAQDDYTCNLCGEPIARGDRCVSVMQFGYNLLRLHASHLTV